MCEFSVYRCLEKVYIVYLPLYVTPLLEFYASLNNFMASALLLESN